MSDIACFHPPPQAPRGSPFCQQSHLDTLDISQRTVNTKPYPLIHAGFAPPTLGGRSRARHTGREPPGEEESLSLDTTRFPDFLREAARTASDDDATSGSTTPSASRL